MSKHALKFKGARSKSRTKQCFKDEVNINTIARKIRRSGVLPFKGPEDTIFQDLTGVTDFKEAMDRVTSIQQTFDSLPAVIRTKFGNNPADILKYLQDPKNEEEARNLGLLRPLTREEMKARDDAAAAAEAAAKEEKAPEPAQE